ncbi:alpha/beta fold hydrolase [Ornithinicoccus halotolerans]|uniref:alpha/beta fold hydrolase n=1 Tax=Ornithinicoccus halotolerans TaxID=1748220 RepID=UPI0012965480|nr:alpha/beta hydrolase [Ornithinicoccus halotolerans]
MSTSYLARPEGRLAYELAGDAGPLVIAAPGMGDLRQTYRLLIPRLTGLGCRVATLDLRGHGDSDATFGSYDDTALAEDLLALIRELGEPAFVIGNSMAAGAAAIAAAEAPEQVRGLVLLGPFVRDPQAGRLQKLLLRAALTKPWGPAAFLAYYPQWLPGQKPEGYEEHKALIRDNLRRPGHWRAFVRTTRTSHELAERRLAQVEAPAVVVMGEADIDWKDPAAEGAWVAEQLHAELVLVPGVGHYPQAQAPEVVAEATARLIERVTGA